MAPSPRAGGNSSPLQGAWVWSWVVLLIWTSSPLFAEEAALPALPTSAEEPPPAAAAGPPPLGRSIPASSPSGIPSPAGALSGAVTSGLPGAEGNNAKEEALEKAKDQKFRKQLTEMLSRTEKSIKLIGEQIAQSQSAPFLPDLYLKQADFWTEKSNTLYYIEMENLQGGSVPKGSDAVFAPVVEAQKEAIKVYQLLIQDFPGYSKRDQVFYQLATAYKAIDDTPGFMKAAGIILHEYGHGRQAAGIRLMLGQTYFDQQDFDEARKLIQPVTQTDFVYERSLAKYRLGLIDVAQDRCRDAMIAFENVIADVTLKEEENPYNITLKSRGAKKTDLKREALIDSVRCINHVPEKDADAIGYYSKIAPTEIHFQEVIEKLSQRYIFLKRYPDAIKLLRALSERISEPQKVVNIYHDVLLAIPVPEREKIPASEIAFLLEKYKLWTTFFTLVPAVRKEVTEFFEKQVRELATTSHARSRTASSEVVKADYLQRSRDLYRLYLAYFPQTPATYEIALNLADVYYQRNEFVRSGDFYLRLASGAYGKPPSKKPLLDSALFCLQKKYDASFYDKIRAHGLLIRTVQTYMQFDPAKKNDTDLNFLVAKAKYEQAIFPSSLNELFAFMKTHRDSKRSNEAGELILDYYNTRGDFDGLKSWAGKMQALHLPDATFNTRLTQLQASATAKVVQEKIRASAGFDNFSQGKSYLALALNSGDKELANSVLKEALAKSRRERDVDTFIQAARLMASQEKDPSKKGEILGSISHEQIQMSRYYQGVQSLRTTYNNGALPAATRKDNYEEALSSALLLKDWTLLAEMAAYPLFSQAAQSLRDRVKEQALDLIGSPIALTAAIESLISRAGPGNSPEFLLASYQAQGKLNPRTYARIAQTIRQTCSASGNPAVVCRWSALEQLDRPLAAFKAQVAGPATVQGVEANAQAFANLTNQFKALENSGDLILETMTSVRTIELYTQFQSYLARVAQANPQLASVLAQKAQETATTANQYKTHCQQVVSAGQGLGFNPAARYCASATAPATSTLFRNLKSQSFSSPTQDPSLEKITNLQKNLFARSDLESSTLSLAKEYYAAGYYHHAAATAATGVATLKGSVEDFETILGCSVAKLGLTHEAAYHLKKGGSANGLKEQCTASLNSLQAALQ